MPTLETSLNFPGFLLQKAQQHSSKVVAFHQVDNDRRAPIFFEPILWQDFATRIKALAAGLIGMGLLVGERVAILGNTSLCWTITDLAIMSTGAVTVPIYPASGAEEIAYVLNHSGARFLFVEDQRSFKQLSAKLSTLQLENIFSFEAFKHDSLTPLTLEQLSQRGIEHMAENPGLLNHRLESFGRESLATIVYTSGTSGQLKGVRLSHHNILEQLRAIATRIPIYDTDANGLLAFLTSAHIYERVAGEWYFLSQSCPIYFCNRIERLSDYMKAGKATFALVVPLILERIRKKVLNKIKQGPFPQRNLLEIALKLGIALKTLELGQDNLLVTRLARLLHGVLYRLILEKLKQNIFPSLRLIISGGAALSQHTNYFFHALGIYVSEGYGLTETTGPVYANNLEKPCIGSVGQAIGKVQIRLAQDQEILLKGEVLTKGYWQAPAENEAAFTEDGWYRTGDLGRLDQRQNLYITGRKKDLIVTMGGKNVSPVLIEEKLKESDLINQIAVFGDGQKWMGALITLNQDEFLSRLGQAKVTTEQWHKILDQAKSYELIRSEITQYSHGLAEHEKVKRFLLLPEAFSTEGGELTPTLKLKRQAITQKYAQALTRLFE